MLRIRVVMKPLAGGESQTIWDRPIVSRNAPTLFEELRDLSWSTQRFGEKMDMKFDDGAGSRCRVQASFHGGLISPIEGGHEVELNFAGDKWRVW